MLVQPQVAEKRLPNRPLYKFLSLEGTIVDQPYPGILPFGDSIKYEKLDVIERHSRAYVAEDIHGVKTLTPYRGKVVRKCVRFNPFKEDREIKKYDEWIDSRPTVEIVHENGDRRIISKKPSAVMLWDMRAGILYATHEELGRTFYDLFSKLDEFTCVECMESFKKDFEELKAKNLIQVMNDKVKLTKEGEKTLANYLRNWWNHVGDWKELYENRISPVLLNFAKHGLLESAIETRIGSPEQSKSPRTYIGCYRVTYGHKIFMSAQALTRKEAELKIAENRSNVLTERYQNVSIGNIKMKRHKKERPKLPKGRLRRGFTSEGREIQDRIDVLALANQMKENSDEFLVDLYQRNRHASWNVIQAAGIVLRERYGEQYLLNLRSPSKLTQPSVSIKSA